MNFKSILLVLLVGAGAFAGGMWLGRNHAAPAAKSTTTSTAPRLPAVPTSAPPAKPAAPSASNNSKITALADAEQALNDLKNVSQSKRWEKLRDLARSLDPALFPQV